MRAPRSKFRFITKRSAIAFVVALEIARDDVEPFRRGFDFQFRFDVTGMIAAAPGDLAQRPGSAAQQIPVPHW